MGRGGCVLRSIGFLVDGYPNFPASFREPLEPETEFPRTPLLGIPLNRGNPPPSALGARAVDAFYLCPVQGTNKSRVVQAAFEAMLRGNNAQAAAIIQDEYAF